jgi:hypothetical protein
LLIDVDGVISLFGFDHTSPPAAFPVAVDGIPHWISEGAGPRLIRLARTFECVWCTGWEERAEEHLGVATNPAVGITDEHVTRLEALANGGH